MDDGIIHLKTDNRILYEYTQDLAEIQRDGYSGSIPTIFTIRDWPMIFWISGPSTKNSYLAKDFPFIILNSDLPHEKIIKEPPGRRMGMTVFSPGFMKSPCNPLGQGYQLRRHRGLSRAPEFSPDGRMGSEFFTCLPRISFLHTGW